MEFHSLNLLMFEVLMPLEWSSRNRRKGWTSLRKIGPGLSKIYCTNAFVYSKLTIKNDRSKKSIIYYSFGLSNHDLRRIHMHRNVRVVKGVKIYIGAKPFLKF